MDHPTSGTWLFTDTEGAYHLERPTACEFELGLTYEEAMKSMQSPERAKFLEKWTFVDLDDKNELELNTFLYADGADATLQLFDTTGATSGAYRGSIQTPLASESAGYGYILNWYDTIELKEPEEKMFEMPAVCKDKKAEAKAKANNAKAPGKFRLMGTQQMAEMDEIEEEADLWGTEGEFEDREFLTQEVQDAAAYERPVGLFGRRRKSATLQEVKGQPTQEVLDLKHDLVAEGKAAVLETTVDEKGKVTAKPEEKFEVEINHDKTKKIYASKRKEGTKWLGTNMFLSDGQWMYEPDASSKDGVCRLDSGETYETLTEKWASLDFAGKVKIPGKTEELKMWIGDVKDSSGKPAAMYVLVDAKTGLEERMYWVDSVKEGEEVSMTFNEQILEKVEEKKPEEAEIKFPDTCDKYKKACNVKDARKCVASILATSIFEDTKCEVMQQAHKCYVDTWCLQHKARVCNSKTGKQCSLKGC
eukprot:TRINITY_DN16459_c0_g1_i1.p1 TRINITY_DN16459_c0_g1~~TRINITY_DN16459_c0_g1_i1.p1  ORF type:complete len:544 (-),score=98.57 TRINITY_DN16459_c0_g1_i1:219-1646(-)